MLLVVEGLVAGHQAEVLTALKKVVLVAVVMLLVHKEILVRPIKETQVEVLVLKEAEVLEVVLELL